MRARVQASAGSGTGVQVKSVMDTWTLQMGYPMLEVTRTSTNTVIAQQQRFLLLPDANDTSPFTSPFGYSSHSHLLSIAKLVERHICVSEIRSLVPGQVEAMTYKVDTRRFLAWRPALIG